MKKGVEEKATSETNIRRTEKKQRKAKWRGRKGRNKRNWKVEE